MLRRFSLALALLALPVSAQQTINNASVEGRITDTSSALIVGATITARNTATGIAAMTTSNNAGYFRFPYLAVGSYEISARAKNFRITQRNTELNAGATVSLNFELRATGAETTITLDENIAPNDSMVTQVSATLSYAEVTQLPYVSRSFLDLALLAPGVSATNTAANQLFAETSAVPGQGLSINSQRNFSNSFLIDGLSANDDAAGLVQAAFPLDSIASLQVVTSGGQAEFGRALGGYLNFVTRAGTNHFHGTAYGFLRNQRMNAANALTQTTPPMTQAQFGGSIGGPIVRDHSFFFLNAEQRNLNQNGILTITPSNAAAINTALAATGYAGPRLTLNSTATNLYSNPAHSTNLFGRFDNQFSGRDNLSARYSLYHVTAQNSRGAGGLIYTSAATALEDFDHTVAVSNILVITPQTMNETRAQFTDSDLSAPVNDPIGPSVSISGVATFGTSSTSPTGRKTRLFEVVDNLSHQLGKHSLRAGTDFLYNDLRITFPQSIRGNYAFSSLANFQAGRYTTFTQSFGNYVIPQTNPNLGVYVQDEWHATPSLTLNAGVRYDLQFLQTIHTDHDNVSPRVGLAWTPFTSGRTILRASYGLFYDRVPLRALSNALQSNGNSTTLGANTFVTLALSYGQTGAPAFPNINSTAAVPAAVRLSLSTMDPNLQNAYAQQASLEAEQQLAHNTTLSMNFQHVRGEHLLLSVNLNTPTCSATVDPINLCRPIAAYANNKQYSSSADSMYDALGISLVQRPARFGSFRLSYTWSHAMDDLGEFFFSSPINNFNISQDWSRSDDDQRHRLTFDAIVHTPTSRARTRTEAMTHGFTLSGVLQYTSALPFNVVTGGQTIQQTTQRPCAQGYSLSGVTPCTLAQYGAVIGRNTGIGFDAFNLNARLSRTIPLTENVHLEAIAQAFNALNHRNNQIPNATFGTGSTALSTFAQPTAVADPRSVELALRLSF